MKSKILVYLMVLGITSTPPVWDGGLWLYEGGTPDLGTTAA